MALLDEESRNFSLKGWMNIAGTGNRNTAPNNFGWWEEWVTNDLIVKPISLWNDLASIPPAQNLATAQANAVANPTLIADYSLAASAIRLTPKSVAGTNRAWFICSVYGDLTTRMQNWIQPQLIPRTDLGNEGQPSIGYAIRLWDGDPALGGSEIPLSDENNGAVPGIIAMYGAGLIITASSYSGISDNTQVYITGFQYIGPTGGSGGSTVTGTPARIGAEDIDGAVNLIDTDISLYQVPALTYVRGVKVSICNRNNAVVSVRVAHVDGAIGAVANEDYIFYDTLLQPYETKIIEIDGMIPTDSILIRSDTVDVSFIATAQTFTVDDGTKRLAATTVVASTDTALYVATGNVVDVSIIACNHDPSNSAVIRVALVDGAIGALSPEDYILYDDILIEGESRFYGIDIEMINTYTLVVYSTDADVSFICYGREL